MHPTQVVGDRAVAPSEPVDRAGHGAPAAQLGRNLLERARQRGRRSAARRRVRPTRRATGPATQRRRAPAGIAMPGTTDDVSAATASAATSHSPIAVSGSVPTSASCNAPHERDADTRPGVASRAHGEPSHRATPTQHVAPRRRAARRRAGPRSRSDECQHRNQRGSAGGASGRRGGRPGRSPAAAPRLPREQRSYALVAVDDLGDRLDAAHATRSPRRRTRPRRRSRPPALRTAASGNPASASSTSVSSRDERVGRAVGVDGRHRAVVTGVERLQHVERFATAHLADHDAVGAHAQRGTHERRARRRRPHLRRSAGRASSRTTCGCASRSSAVSSMVTMRSRGRDRAGERVQQGGLARARAAGDEHVPTPGDRPTEERRRPRRRARTRRAATARAPKRRMVTHGPSIASGGITACRREPSARRASTIGDARSRRRPSGATTRSTSRTMRSSRRARARPARSRPSRST